MDTSDSANSALSGLNAPVDEKESGQKLLRFLERRLKLPSSLLHRWIRTGQIRLNGSRCKPFDRVNQGDIVRLPPFAHSMATELAQNEELKEVTTDSAHSIEILDIWNDIWAINKASGLPTQSGTGHEDSVASRLAAKSGSDFFKAAPAHRLDRGTSGVLLAGASFEALRALQEEFQKGLIHKEYLAWVKGHWPAQDLILLRHYLRKEKENEMTRMKVLANMAPYAKEALSLVKPVHIEKDKSLLQIRILTGVRHQIRAQLAAMGHPVMGDRKYGQDLGEQLLLHSFRIILPDGHEFSVQAPWLGDLAPRELPAAILPNLSNTEAELELSKKKIIPI